MGCKDGTVVLFKVRDGSQLALEKVHQDSINCIAVFMKQAITGSSDKTLCWFSLDVSSLGLLFTIVIQNVKHVLVWTSRPKQEGGGGMYFPVLYFYHCRVIGPSPLPLQCSISYRS